MKPAKWLFRFTFLFSFPLAAVAQKAERVVPAKAEFFKKQLGSSDQTAQQVAVIMDDYKAKMRLIEDNKTLSDTLKRAQADRVIDEKNAKLKQLLPADQWPKLIPASELRKAAN